MGRTNPTFRDNLRKFRDRWAPFKRALRQQYKEHFEGLLEQGERFADAAGFQNPADADKAILVSMLLGHEADLQELDERVTDLEDRIDDETG